MTYTHTFVVRDSSRQGQRLRPSPHVAVHYMLYHMAIRAGPTKQVTIGKFEREILRYIEGIEINVIKTVEKRNRKT